MKRFKRVYVEITNICNLNCRFCEPSKRKQEFMQLKDVNLIFKKIKEYTDYIYLHIKGEPLLHPQIGEILKLAEDNELHVIITTNGTMLVNNIGVLSISKAIRQINISLHSIEQNMDINMNKERYLKKIFNSIEEITKNNDIYISYRLWNLNRIDKLEKNIYILNAIKKFYNIPDLLELLKNVDFVKISDNKYINLDTIYEWPSLKKEVVSKCGSCYGLRTQMAILVDGTVVPCCLDQDGDMKLGNIFESDLKDILNSELSIKITDGFKKHKLVHPLCQRCGFRIDKRR